jgi:anaerobic selenocysteine-containing dehydrogenase
MDAKGKTFEPPMKGVIGPIGLAYKKRVYSKNRVRYPLKREDWDPKAGRNTQNRGKSGYVRISWEEAIELVASRGAYVTERLMPSVAYMDHGSRWDPIIPGKLDRGGAINTITPHKATSRNATGMVVSGFLVDVRKVTDEEMALWRKEYPEAFSREYDPDTGVSLSGWLKG